MRVVQCAASAALFFSLGGLLTQPVPAAPVTVKTADKPSDNLVDPNAEEAVPAARPAWIATVDTSLIEKGQGMYKSYCQKCHGLQMVTPGGAIFDLRTFPMDDKPRFFSSVTNGKRAMPAWGALFKMGDIEALWSYVASYQLMKTVQSPVAESK